MLQPQPRNGLHTMLRHGTPAVVARQVAVGSL